jgi:hypothetical protein
MMSEVFWSFLITSLVGFIIALLKLCYKSKCKEISCCCLKIVRDIESEVEVDEIELTKQPTTPSNSQS